jgi:hypothetical protein
VLNHPHQTQVVQHFNSTLPQLPQQPTSRMLPHLDFTQRDLSS